MTKMSLKETTNKIKVDLSGSRYNSLLRIVAVIILALLLVGVYRTYKIIWPAHYIAKQNGFEIVFGGTPTVNQLSPQKLKDGVIETGTTYNLDNTSKGTDYAVYVTDYSGVNFNSLSKSSTISNLDDELETLAQNDQGNLSNGENVTFLGLPAVKATLNPTNHSVPSTEVLTFLNKSKLYVILGGGISRSKFNDFTKTFRFIN